MSADDGPRSHDLTKRQCNQLVIDASFFPDNALKDQYTFDATHDMMTEIILMRRLAVRELTVRLAFCEKDPVFDGNDDDVARDLSEDLLEGLRYCEKLNVMKIMGAISHPLFQNKKRMVASGI